MLVLHRMSTDVSKSQSMRNNYGNELFHGNLILIFTKDAPSPRLNLSSLCWIRFSRMTFPRISRKQIYFHRILPTSKFVQIHIGCITKVPFKFERLMEKKITFFRVESTFIEISISFFDHQPLSQCLCQKEVLPKIALCCNDLPGASFSAC